MAAPRKKQTKKPLRSEKISDLPLSKAEQAAIEQMLIQSLLRHKDDDFDTKAKHKEMSHLSTIAQEYLSSFVIVGYSLQDEKVVVTHMPTAKDECALVDLLRSTLLDIAGDRP